MFLRSSLPSGLAGRRFLSHSQAAVSRLSGGCRSVMASSGAAYGFVPLESPRHGADDEHQADSLFTVPSLFRQTPLASAKDARPQAMKSQISKHMPRSAIRCPKFELYFDAAAGPVITAYNASPGRRSFA